jgi:hypothetical protein
MFDMREHGRAGPAADANVTSFQLYIFISSSASSLAATPTTARFDGYYFGQHGFDVFLSLVSARKFCTFILNEELQYYEYLRIHEYGALDSRYSI